MNERLLLLEMIEKRRKGVEIYTSYKLLANDDSGEISSLRGVSRTLAMVNPGCFDASFEAATVCVRVR